MTWSQTRGPVLRTAASVGAATGAYGLSFGALSTTSGLSVLQTCALSVLTFSGGSQFAFIATVGAGGSLVSASSSALLLGARNVIYGARLTQLLGLRGWRKLVGAQLVVDETTAVALAHEESGPRAGRLGFWATGLTVFVLWNAFTLVGALAGTVLGDPRDLGLDAAVPAAFLALVWPRLRERSALVVGLAAAVVALLLVPLTPAGVPVLLSAGVPVVAVLLRRGAS